MFAGASCCCCCCCCCCLEPVRWSAHSACSLQSKSPKHYSSVLVLYAKVSHYKVFLLRNLAPFWAPVSNLQSPVSSRKLPASKFQVCSPKQSQMRNNIARLASQLARRRRWTRATLSATKGGPQAQRGAQNKRSASSDHCERERERSTDSAHSIFNPTRAQLAQQQAAIFVLDFPPPADRFSIASVWPNCAARAVPNDTPTRS